MKKALLIIALCAGIVGCNTTRSIEKQVSAGRYDSAINDALKKLSLNKNRKSKQESIQLLKSAFTKATERDLNDIVLLRKDANPENYERIYNLYQVIDNRQEKIKPVLPLYLREKEVNFNFQNYDDQIVAFKDKTTNYLYDKAVKLLSSGDRMNARLAYDDFKYIDNISPNYKDVRVRTVEASDAGKDYVLMSLKNETAQIIPNVLQEELLNISTYGLNDQWTVFHNKMQASINYDYQMDLIFNNIIISPEQINERQLVQEKLVKDGFTYELDRRGNVKKDSLGNDIKKDKFVKVVCQYNETRQFKTATVAAIVQFEDLQTMQMLDRFPLESTYLFEHFYATFNGDRRALEDRLLGFVNNRRVPFPTNEQMVFDSGEDLKLRLKNIIASYNFGQ